MNKNPDKCNVIEIINNTSDVLSHMELNGLNEDTGADIVEVNEYSGNGMPDNPEMYYYINTHLYYLYYSALYRYDDDDLISMIDGGMVVAAGKINKLE